MGALNFMSSPRESDLSASPASLPAEWQDFILLLKPRVMSLVVFTGIVGLLLAPGTLHPILAVTSILCIAIGAGAAGSINMWYDRDIDSVMQRTQHRPLPAGRMEPTDALGFGCFLAIAAITVMGLSVNWMAASLLAVAIGFYVFIYTIWLKRRTPMNIVIGGAAGALPPMIGWAAVTGDISVTSLTLFAIIFMWTPPHFWALSLYRRSDYIAAKIPMLPVVSGASVTRRQILLYTLLLLPISLIPTLTGTLGWLYGITALGLGLGFIFHALRVIKARCGDLDADIAPACAMFRFSLYHLFVLFSLAVVDSLLLDQLEG